MIRCCAAARLLLRPQVRAPKVEEVSTVEASLRLDAIASAGFRMSRSKMTDAIKSGARRGGGDAASQRWLLLQVRQQQQQQLGESLTPTTHLPALMPAAAASSAE